MKISRVDCEKNPLKQRVDCQNQQGFLPDQFSDITRKRDEFLLADWRIAALMRCSLDTIFVEYEYGKPLIGEVGKVCEFQICLSGMAPKQVFGDPLQPAKKVVTTRPSNT